MLNVNGKNDKYKANDLIPSSFKAFCNNKNDKKSASTRGNTRCHDNKQNDNYDGGYDEILLQTLITTQIQPGSDDGDLDNNLSTQTNKKRSVFDSDDMYNNNNNDVDVTKTINT